mmetsp:Transcript_20994/g.31102  ORF Transcript_20994/g.31102 Transcript_20994/m.31102 type:complete len:179 (-) Transcript_20994:202-738(-)
MNFLSIISVYASVLSESAIALQQHSLFGTWRGNGIVFRSSMLLLADPSCVYVCTAELCCCQEEGFGGDEILEHLRAQNLPYPTEEAPCLGACGGGAKVSIDFDDGSYALVTGMKETLSELGLSTSDAHSDEELTHETTEQYDDADQKESIKVSETIIATPVDSVVTMQTDNEKKQVVA